MAATKVAEDGTMTDVADEPVTDAEQGTDGSPEQGDSGSTDTNKRPTVQVNVPAELKALIEERAKSTNVSTSAWMANLAAKEFGYDIPAVQRARQHRYASDEERKAAAATRAKEKSDAVTKLIELAKQGQIEGLDPKVKALLGIA